MRKIVLLFLGMLCLSSNTFAQETEYKSSDKPDITHMDIPELRAYAEKKLKKLMIIAQKNV